MVNLDKYRKDFLVLKKNKIIYFDNAATSLKPRPVIEKMNYYYENCPANIHRGIHQLSQEASVIYEETHEKLSKFFNCKPEEVILTNNSTDSLNQIMYMLYNSNYFKKGDEIITTVYEHHANIVPWQFLAKKLGVILKFVEINNDYTYDLEDLEKKITKKTKLITVAQISNTTGVIAPIKKISEIAKKNNCLFVIDGSQSAPHIKIDFKKTGADFFVCTAHKMLGPTGVGLLIGKKELLEKFSPVRFGGDMIKHVTFKNSTWNDLPYKFEAGTPNISGAFGFSSAVEYLEKVGLDNILKQDKKLLEYAINEILKIEDLVCYNPLDIKKQGPILLFNLKGINCRELSTLLDQTKNIATRAGMHCAEPIVSRFDKNGVTRASFYFYNTREEIDVFIDTLKFINKKIK
ncbi:MAG: cysteine desulfurase [Patescibacteria group bacterium]